ncbi:ATP-grasp domain-containing protein [Rathayibacter tanaceti]|uniref:ATP-grasp domain-containing protein n=2 Tax=Rathayibacter tanaceti TaxID=1671680 RepID=A0A166IPM9_9MICO|nr:ATP-grasp domain-containing protein [Rathayibacter tanaceti]KZX22723.1 Alanine-anticapsin ligase BacD [Rathayibacter tanaceti]QHC55911.1 ATP-grasp domain-containing protein [Rathayibacter tanaceti]TCO39256.1 biotin carboxylase [Rathayibacter tanaceti]
MSAPAESVLVISASARTLWKVRDAGLAVVHIEDPTMAAPASAALCVRSLRHTLTDVPALVRLAEQLHAEHRFSGVVTNHEPAIAAAQAIADTLGLPSSGVGALLRDKAALRRALAGSRLALPWAVLSSRADLTSFVREHGLPLIVKPTSGSASLGVFPVREARELDAVWAQVRSLLEEGHRYSAVLPVFGFMIERYVDGPEFSVESVSTDGRHEFLAIVEKTTNEHRVEVAHTVPARLSGEGARRVMDAVRELLDRIGFRAGPAHTEVILGADGVVVVESHARTGGDGIPALVAAVTGRDAERELIALATGRPVPPSEPPTAVAISKRFLEARTGTVVSISGVEAARALAGVREVMVAVEPGDQVQDADASWWRVGEVVAAAASAQAAEDLAARAAAMIRIEVR